MTGRKDKRKLDSKIKTIASLVADSGSDCTKLMDEIFHDVYDRWVESDSYKTESAIENGCYDKRKEEIVKIIGEKCYSQISDSILCAACESEMSGFENGFRYGILFMMGCVNHTVLRKAGATNE